MSTRAQIRFATREDGVSFSEHPDKINAQFYKHRDGYPEGLGLDMAHSIAKLENSHFIISGWEIEHVQTKHGDLEYIYYIWSDYDKDTWISIFTVDYTNNDDEYCYKRSMYRKDASKCIFVGTPKQLIKKYGSQLDESYYKLNTNEDG